MNKYKITHFSAMEITIPINKEEQSSFYEKHIPLIIERSNQLNTNIDESSKIIELPTWFDFADENEEDGYSNAWIEPKWETEVFAHSEEEAINEVKDGYYNSLEGETIGEMSITHDTANLIFGETFKAELV
tara:strand:- start:971 stop:1363 length:393 start_codon:yes stop_codon:yes gene_type:complete